MRHLDANALAQLIGAMAEVVGAMTSPEEAPSTGVPSALARALVAFQDGWSPTDPASSIALAAQAEQLAAAGMAFMEGDPVTAGQLVDVPARTAAGAAIATASASASAWTLGDRIGQLRAVESAADEVATDLTGRRLARRAFSGVDDAIRAYRDVATGHCAVADALQAYLDVADAAEERRRIVEELLDDTARAARAVSATPDQSAGVYLARLHDKALSVSDEASASVDRCVAAVHASIPALGSREAVVDGIGQSVEEVCKLLAKAAASERSRLFAGGRQGPDPGDRRTMA